MTQARKQTLTSKRAILLANVMSTHRKQWENLTAKDLILELQQEYGFDLSTQQIYKLRNDLGWKKIHKPVGSHRSLTKGRKENAHVPAMVRALSKDVEALQHSISLLTTKLAAQEAQLAEIRFKRMEQNDKRKPSLLNAVR